MRKLVVYGTVLAAYRNDSVFEHYTNPSFLRQRQLRAVVAARTKKEACDLFGITYAEFSNYAGETGNEEEIRWAMENPGKVMARPLDARGPYFEITRTPHVVRPRIKRKPYVFQEPKPSFNQEEIETILARFQGANDPVGQSIVDKCRKILIDKNN